MKEILLGVKNECDPTVFCYKIRPWFRGVDSFDSVSSGSVKKNEWVFEGLEKDTSLYPPSELSGPSAGQSTLVHALDVFLGVDQYSTCAQSPSPASRFPTGFSSVHPPFANFGQASQSETKSGVSVLLTPRRPVISTVTGAEPMVTAHELGKRGLTRTKSYQVPSPPRTSMERMQLYMPRHHRLFLKHLAASPQPLRLFVENEMQEVANRESDSEVLAGRKLKEAYNAAVLALKEFRDAHMQIVTCYVILPSARRSASEKPELEKSEEEREHAERLGMKGTGGTNLVRFLKEVRHRTTEALIN